MRRFLSVLAVVALAACGSTGDVGPQVADVITSTTEPSTATTLDSAAWLEQFEPYSSMVEVEGTSVGVKEEAREIYLQDCSVADELTAEGSQFGPTPRDATGDFHLGYGYVCTAEDGTTMVVAGRTPAWVDG